MEKWKRRSIDLVASLAFGDSGELSVVPYYPQKTKISRVEDLFFRRTIPEKKGISSARLYNMLCELEADRRANIHSIMVLCDGEVICECSREGYSTREWHVSHSMSKTVCGMVIGRLIDDGKLSTEDILVDIFPEIPYKDKRFSSIRIDHLLSMSCGVDFAEAGAITEQDWTRVFFSSSMRFAPGEKFFYNSMNSYILARVAERVSGQSFGRLCESYIFEPLGITNYLWEIGPEGTEKAGWGLYMSPESWAKLGVMFLNDGVFFGKRVLSSRWVERSSTTKAISPKENGDFNYAYQMWIGSDNREILFNGMFGQNVWICPKNNIVVVTTGGNNELFQASAALDIIRKYLGGELNDKINRRDVKYLIQKQNSFFKSRMWAPPMSVGGGFFVRLGIGRTLRFDRRWENLVGNYEFAENNASLLPMIIRGMQNNLSGNISSARIERDGVDIIMSFETEGEVHNVPIGLYGYRTAILDFKGERYIVRSVGRAIRNPDGEVCYRVEMIFPETASRRMLIIRKNREGRIEISLSETPNNKILESFFRQTARQGSKLFILLDIFEKRLGPDSLSEMIYRMFNPTIVGAEEGSAMSKSIIEGENKRRLERSGKLRIIRAVIDRLFK